MSRCTRVLTLELRCIEDGPGGTSRLVPDRDTLRLIQQIIESRSIQKLPIQHHGLDPTDMTDVEGRLADRTTKLAAARTYPRTAISAH